MKNISISRKQFIQICAAALFAVVMIAPFNACAQGSKTNFAGTWAFNETKSNLGEGGMGRFRAGSQFTVTQDATTLTVSRTRTNQNGEATTTTEKYTLDGKESVNQSGRGGASKSVVTFSADGKTLNFATTRSFERDGQTTEMKSSEVWTLTDAKTLSVKSTSNFGGQERVTTIVYDKK